MRKKKLNEDIHTVRRKINAACVMSDWARYGGEESGRAMAEEIFNSIRYRMPYVTACDRIRIKSNADEFQMTARLTSDNPNDGTTSYRNLKYKFVRGRGPRMVIESHGTNFLDMILEAKDGVDYSVIKDGYYNTSDGLHELKSQIDKLVKKYPDNKEVSQLRGDFDRIWKIFQGANFSKVGKQV